MEPVSFVLGTAANCDVVFEDEYMSAHHCRVWRDAEGRHWIEDLGTVNGTWVIYAGGPSFGGRVPPGGKLPIFPGVQVRIGRTVVGWRKW